MEFYAQGQYLYVHNKWSFVFIFGCMNQHFSILKHIWGGGLPSVLLSVIPPKDLIEVKWFYSFKSKCQGNALQKMKL